MIVATRPDPAAKAVAENFPVALRVLPRSRREELMAVYGYARFVDDLGDELAGGPAARLAALDDPEVELDRAFSGTATHPVFARLAPVIADHRLDRQPFADLIEANRRDQTTTGYETFDDLLGYCRLSANPVGRIVLGLSGCHDADAVALSDEVCSGLQVVEHLQDVAEDATRGRIYLPREDLRAFGVDEGQLLPAGATPATVRRLVAFEAGRARRLLAGTAELAARLRGTWKLAIAGFGGGGLAQLAALERAGYDVLGPRRPIQADKVARAAAALRMLRGSR